MVDDILSEDPVAISQAPKYIAGRPHISTVWRWYKHGCQGVKLETYLSGGRRYTSREAIARFQRGTTEARDGVTSAPTPSRKRQAAIAKAEAELEAAGI